MKRENYNKIKVTDLDTALEKITLISEYGEDNELDHYDADAVLIELVATLGDKGKEISKIFEAMEKWYA